MMLRHTHAQACRDARLLVDALEKLATEDRAEQIDDLAQAGARAARKLARYLRSFGAIHSLYWDRPSDGLPF